MGCCDTKWYDLPLGDPCTAQELKHYFNSLLCQIDEKIHDVQMLCANPNGSQMECIVSDLNQLRYKVIAIEQAIAKNNIRMKCIAERNNENHLDIIKLDERLKVAVVDIDNALLKVKEAVAKVDLVAEQFDEVQETVTSFDSRMNKAEDNIKENENAIVRNDNSINQLNQIIDNQGDKIDEQNDIINAIKDAIAELNNGVSDLRLSDINLSGEIDVLDKRVDDLEDSMENVQNSITSLRTDLNVDEGRISAVESLYGNLSTRVQALRTDVDAILAGGTGGDGGDYTAAIESLQNSVNEINTDIEELTTTLNSINGNLDGTITRVSALETTTEGHTTSITALQTDVRNLGSEVGGHTYDITQLQNKNETIEQSVSENTDDISTLVTKTNTMEQTIAGQADEIGDLLSTDARHDVSINAMNQRLDAVEDSLGEDNGFTFNQNFIQNKNLVGADSLGAVFYRYKDSSNSFSSSNITGISKSSATVNVRGMQSDTSFIGIATFVFNIPFSSEVTSNKQTISLRGDLINELFADTGYTVKARIPVSGSVRLPSDATNQSLVTVVGEHWATTNIQVMLELRDNNFNELNVMPQFVYLTMIILASKE